MSISDLSMNHSGFTTRSIIVKKTQMTISDIQTVDSSGVSSAKSDMFCFSYEGVLLQLFGGIYSATLSFANPTH